MRKKWITLMAIALLFTGCSRFGSDSAMTLEQRREAALLLDSRLAEETNKLGLKLFSQLREQQTGNLTISPYSISAALAVAYNGSAGVTAAELGELLGYAPAEKDKMNTDHKALLRLLNNAGTGLELKTANSIWGKEDLPLRKEYLRMGEDNYDAAIRTTDLAGKQSVKEINKWVADQTEQKIKKMLEEPPGRDAVAVLVNAVYFKAGWQNEFLEGNTHQADFYPSADTAVEVAMMKQSGQFMYAESGNWQAIRLPYGEGQMDMLVILPNVEYSLAELQSEFLKRGLPNETTFAERKGEINLPRFKVSYGTDLKNELKALGVKQAFDPNLGDFSGMAATAYPIYVEQIVHKTFIEVNERGTEAAASTLIGFRAGSAPSPVEPFQMNVNRPFYYVIEDNQTGVWLFLGIVENPLAGE